MTIQNNQITGNSGDPLHLNYDFHYVTAGIPVFVGNILNGNAVDGIGLEGMISEDMILPNQGVTYISYGLNVAAGVALTVKAGVVVKFDYDVNMGISGSLKVSGRAGSEVYFTSLRDDSVGGDTNLDGNATQPHVGDWRGISIYGQAVIDYATIRYVLRDFEGAAIGVADNSSLTLRNSLLEKNGIYGVSAGQATITVANSIFRNNILGGMRTSNSSASVSGCTFEDMPMGINNVSDAPIVSATNNYWGHPSGPFNPTTNPAGQGVEVSDYVDYDPWLVTPRVRQAIPIELNQSQTHHVYPQGFTDFLLEAPAGLSLMVQVTPLDANADLWVYSHFGALPLWNAYDVRSDQISASGTVELLISPSQLGGYYFSIFGHDVLQTGVDFDILITPITEYLSLVSPQSAGNAGQTTIQLFGAPFVEGMSVELRANGLPTLYPTGINVFSLTELFATFDLNGAATGVYSIVATLPGGHEVVLSDAFTISTGIGPKLVTNMVEPEGVRIGQKYVLWVEYGNAGDADLPIPLIVVNTVGSWRLTPDEPFRTDQIQVLGINQNHPIGVLPPGATLKIPILQRAPLTGLGGKVTKTLSVLDDYNSAIDWDQVEAEIKPEIINSDLWSIIFAQLKVQIGDTWGDYYRTLVQDAEYLAEFDRFVYSVKDLFRFEMKKAIGLDPLGFLAGDVDAAISEPGLSLQFSRLFPSNLERQFYLGPLGRGWSHNYDIHLEIREDENVLIHWPGAFSRLFIYDGSYSPLPGDYGKLILNNSHFELTEKNGTRFVFNPEGTLAHVEDTNGNRISLIYDGNDRLVTIQHSNGDHFTLSYNGLGRIQSLTDQAGRITEYLYDASGEHLTQVIAPGNRPTFYNYSADQGLATDHTLLEIGYADGSHKYFAYDSLGRISSNELDNGEERITYTYDAMGRITITDLNQKSRIFWLDEYGRLSKMQDTLGFEIID